MTQSNGGESIERRQQELYFNVDGVLTTLMLRTKQENMSVLDVKRRDEATERILSIIEADRKQHELDAITFTVTNRADISYATLERPARGDNVGALRQLEQVDHIYAELKKEREAL